MSNIVTKSALTRQFDQYATTVLGAYLTAQPHERRKQRKFAVTKPLPTPEEYAALRNKRFTATLDDLVSDAFSIFEELNGELQDWYDNLPESFQSGSKGDELQEATGILENLSAPDVPECLQSVNVVYLPGLDVSSRADRNGEATGQLQAVYDTVEKILDTGKIVQVNDDGDVLPERDITSDERDELESFRDEIDNAKNEAEGVSFPGMY